MHNKKRVLSTALHFDLCNQRAVQRKYAFYTFAIGNLAHSESGIGTGVAAADHYTLKCLQAFALTFHHFDVHDNRIARAEYRDLFAHLCRFNFLDHLAHGFTPT
jgi:hypothetical protein